MMKAILNIIDTIKNYNKKKFLYFGEDTKFFNNLNYKLYNVKKDDISLAYSFIKTNHSIFMFMKRDELIGNIETEKKVINKALEKNYTIIFDNVCLNQFEGVLVNYGLLIDDFIKELQNSKYSQNIIITTKMKTQLKAKLDDIKFNNHKYKSCTLRDCKE